MAISVDPITGEITVPRNEYPIIQASPEIRAFDTDDFRLQLKDWEASVDGIPWTDTHIHNTEVTLSGITYGRFIEIIAPYFITMEDGQYTFRLDGSNNNIVDVATANQVRLIANNSAGLTNPDFATITQQEVRDAMELTSTSGEGSIDLKLNNNFSAIAGLYGK